MREAGIPSDRFRTLDASLYGSGGEELGGAKRIRIGTPDIPGPAKNGSMGTTFNHLARLLAGWDHEVVIAYVNDTAIGNYVHVSDLADAHVAAVWLLLAGGESITLNLGTGTGISVEQSVSTVEQVTGRSVPRHVAPRRPGHSPYSSQTARVPRTKSASRRRVPMCKPLSAPRMPGLHAGMRQEGLDLSSSKSMNLSPGSNSPDSPPAASLEHRSSSDRHRESPVRAFSTRVLRGR